MPIDFDKLEVQHNAAAKRFEIALGDQFAFIEYMQPGRNIIFTHTEVPVEYEGHGLANKLARHVMDYARDQGFKVQALCPFVAAYVKKHREYWPITWGFEDRA